MIKTMSDFQHTINKIIEPLQKCYDDGFLNSIGEDNLTALKEVNWFLPFFNSLENLANSEEMQAMYEKWGHLEKVQQVKFFLDRHYKDKED